jgi:LacI family transcriptional regulator
VSELSEQRDQNGRVSAVTLYDVAKAAEVSTATVSRVLHNDPRVREETRQRVLAAIEQLDYVPNGAAQSLSRKRKDVIGLVSVERLAPGEDPMARASLSFVEEVLRGVEAALRAEGLSLLICFLKSGQGAFERLQALSGKVEGLIISEGIVPSAMLARVAKRVPVVVVAGSRTETAVDVVAADNWGGTAELVSHLVRDHSLERLYCVSGPMDAPDARERREAFRAAVSDCGAEEVGWYEGNFSTFSGEEAARQLLALPSHRSPQAVVCGNDLMAIGVMRELSWLGIRVPEDVAVVGFDDMYPAAIYTPPLTTVRQPATELGARASRRLLEKIGDPTLPPTVEVLPTRMVLRASCGCEMARLRRDDVSIAPQSMGRSDDGDSIDLTEPDKMTHESTGDGWLSGYRAGCLKGNFAV